jgi:hypothetical protein
LVLPNFLAIGAMKAGTSALHVYLGKHPNVFLPKPKELNFFVAELNWSRGLPWYERHFAAAAGAAAVGEVCPQYTKATQHPGVPARIAEVIPDAKLVYLIRDPIERMCSAYLHRVGSGREERPIEEAFQYDEPYLNDSCYAYQLEQYLPYFDRRQILVIESAELRHHPQQALHRIWRFLGLPDVPLGTDDLPEVNRTATKHERHPAIHVLAKGSRRFTRRRVPRSLRRRLVRVGARELDLSRAELPEGLRLELRRRLEPDVRRLRGYLGHDFHGWGIA